MGELPRLFIAIEVPDVQRNELNSLQKRIKQHLEGVKWVRPEGLHLTLKFLGETEADKIDSIRKVMDSSVAAASRFQVQYSGIGVFPDTKKARVVWVGLKEGVSEVQKLADEIENNLSMYQFVKENRPYHPHLTLGRLRYPLPEKKIQHVLDQERNFITKTTEIEKITLYHSQLLKHGAIYSEVYNAII